jgi:teichoic acid transport system ATP-binding protein
MNDIVINVKNLKKTYKLYDNPMDRMKESLSITHKNYHKQYNALNDISFNIRRGQTVGIIGTNGSGKSTLLKILTGVLSKSSGNVEVNGRISALLELGAGFNMEYTGIENVYLNGTMMGYSKEEMNDRLENIIDFADIGDL